MAFCSKFFFTALIGCVAAALALALGTPYWYNVDGNHYGLLVACSSSVCARYGNLPSDIPNKYFEAAAFLIGAACVIYLFALLFSIFGWCTQVFDTWNVIFTVAADLCGIAGVLVAYASTAEGNVCSGTSSAFSLGSNCSIGWSGYVAMGGAAAGVIVVVWAFTIRCGQSAANKITPLDA